MSSASVSLPATSPLHRMPAGAKILGLVAAEVVVLAAVRTPAAGGVAGVAVALLYAAARVTLRAVWVQLRAIAALAVVVGAAQAFVLGPTQAVVLAGQMLLTVALAVLATLTTTTTELLDVVERCLGPWRRLGVDPARVALVLALAIRSVPVVGSLASEVREAHRARGLHGGPHHYAVPLVVRTLRYAEELGDALAARGVDD